MRSRHNPNPNPNPNLGALKPGGAKPDKMRADADLFLAAAEGGADPDLDLAPPPPPPPQQQQQQQQPPPPPPPQLTKGLGGLKAAAGAERMVRKLSFGRRAQSQHAIGKGLTLAYA